MKKRPNLLFILTDDQGAWALRCAGNTDIQTPNLDRLAAQGTRFDNFFCASPVCSPARASILTGRIPSQHGVHDWIRSGSLDKQALGEHANHPYFASEGVPIQYLQGLITYPDLLVQNGYTCALAGKWHLGDSMHPQHGFSHWYTIGRGGCLYNQADVVENGELHFESRYITDLITEHALDYLDAFARQDNPFYVSVHYTAPHDPWDEDQHPAKYIDLYRDCAFTATPDEPLHPDRLPTAPGGTGEERKRLLRGYYAAVTAMDAGVGRLLDRLEELGVAEDTLVIFTSDNGMNMGHHGIWGKGNGTFPFNLFDTAVKVPFIARWPGHILPGRVTPSMCSHYDIIQTLNELMDLGAQLPEDLPGHSQAAGRDRLHRVRTAPSPLRELYGQDVVVNSAHHQAADRLGSGFRAVQWAPDGVVEAAVHETLPAWGVQWHPERLSGPFALPGAAEGTPLIAAWLARFG